MRKIFTFLAIAVAMFSLESRAEALQLVFERTDGTQRSFNALGLTMTVSGTSMHVSGASVDEVLELASLKKMYFTADGVSAIGEILLNSSEKRVSVYALNGAELGTFDSVTDAVTLLSTGVYVFRCGESTFKIAVK